MINRTEEQAFEPGTLVDIPPALPIPPHIWKRMQAFLRERKTGKVTLDIHLGNVQGASLEERISREERAKIG